MSGFLPIVRRAFADLIADRDVSVEFSHDDDQAFGNAIVVLVGKGFRVRILRDRGDTSADVARASTPDEWAPLERLLEAIGIAGVRPEGLLTPAEAAGLVRANLEEIEAGFSAGRVDQTAQQLEALGRQRLAEKLERLTRTSRRGGTEA